MLTFCHHSNRNNVPFSAFVFVWQYSNENQFSEYFYNVFPDQSSGNTNTATRYWINQMNMLSLSTRYRQDIDLLAHSVAQCSPNLDRICLYLFGYFTYLIRFVDRYKTFRRFTVMNRWFDTQIMHPHQSTSKLYQEFSQLDINLLIFYSIIR